MAPTITLGNLPESPSIATTASISYATASTGAVYCRLDSYLPVACPNPFVLGQSSALAAGAHTVDYYIDSGSGIDVSKPLTSYAWLIQSPTSVVTAPAPSLTLGNLPANPSTAATASISYTTASPGTVYCRLDTYTPIACPNPFMLGQSSALAAGTHTVDYYVDSGSGIDLTKPSNSYSWTVETAAAAAPAPTAPPVVTAPSTTSLSSAFLTGSVFALEAPSDSDGAGYSAKPYSNGLSISTLSSLPTVSRGGVTRLSPATVNQLPAIRHAVYSGDPLRNGGNRAELSYDSMQIQHGVDYWMGFAIQLDADWTAANGAGSADQQSIMQVHQQNSETTLTNGGPFGIKWRGNSGREIEVFSLGPNNNPVTRFTTASTAGSWMRFIVHYRSGVTTAQAPTLEVWQAVGTGGYTKLTDSAPGSLFGDPAQNVTRDWAKIGIYKWTSGSYGSTTKRGMYSSGLFFGKGTNLYNEAAAAVALYAR